ncbi:alpha-glucosidase [Massilia timonae]|uniref:alpha-glucosidase n=1 Tax=Massilia timonae TaxID=47229 RepID=UPI002352AECB|nr:alpha-glucosidase [Massilia timonae]
MRTRILRPVRALAFLLALNFLLPLSAAAMQAQSPDALASRVDGAYRVGAFSLSFANNGLRIGHAAEPARILWSSVPGRAFLGAAQGQADVRQFGTPDGSYRIDDKLLAQCLAQSIDALERAADTLVVRGRLSGPGCDVSYRLGFDAAGVNQLRFRLQLDGPQAAQLNRSYLRHASSADERYFGLGQQLTWFDQKGKTIPVLVQEHGVGRGLPGFTQLFDLLEGGGGGSEVSTGAPAPHYLSSKLNSLFLENTEYSIFDFQHPERVEIKLFTSALTGRILYGRTPLELIREYTAYTGRMPPLPDWVGRGAIVSVQGGTDEANKKLDTFERAGIPLAGLWIQDWSGVRITNAGKQLWWNWELDESYYPRWDALVDRLARLGARMLVYINPFLSTEAGHDSLYQQARQAGYLVKRQDGTPYLIRNTNFDAALVDLSNPEARTWIKNVIKNELLGHTRASGWMADFGEALPFDAVLADGNDPAAWHNRYPEEWAAVNREAMMEAGREGDVIAFHRSGFTRSPGQGTLFWLGDQLQTWDGYDGIRTAIVGMLSGGVSGYSLLHSDTGGYNAFGLTVLGRQVPVIARNKELWMRWVELNAFTGVLRTHEGLNPAISWQVDSDAETLAHFARMSKIFRALGFYRQGLMQQAADSGAPLVRHPFLEFPSDQNTYALRYQYMLGSDFMVAPVVTRGAQAVRLYLPAGTWIDLWTGRPFDAGSGAWTEVAAPFGKPAVFYKAGSAAGARLVTALRLEGFY